MHTNLLMKAYDQFAIELLSEAEDYDPGTKKVLLSKIIDNELSHIE